MTGAHIHLLLTHVPVMGAIFGLLVLVYAMITKKQDAIKIGFGLFVVTGLVALAAYFSGEGAEEVVEHLAGVSEAAIEEHEEFAFFAMLGAAVLGSVSLLGIAFYRRGIPNWLVNATLVLAIVVNGMLAWTANLGGLIRHPEIRSGSNIEASSADTRGSTHMMEHGD